MLVRAAGHHSSRGEAIGGTATKHEPMTYALTYKLACCIRRLNNDVEEV